MDDLRSAKVIPLGGVCQIGKNMTAIEYAGQILVIDCGLMFPDDEMLGVDIVIPDVTYLLEHADQVQGVILTHGHEDHIGALPYLIRQLNVPIWGTKLTLGLVKAKLDEHGLSHDAELHTIEPGDRFHIGQFDVETIQITHSIPDGVGLAIRLPIGTIVHTGDFKFDLTPIDGRLLDVSRFAELGDEGVLLLLCDSTNVEKPGYVQSERAVGSMFEEVFARAGGKIIVATFASNIHRIQQVFDTALRFDRKVAVAGRSMAQNVEIARELGYLKIPEGTGIRLEDIPDFHPVEVVVMTTGSQGEPLSALTRIAMDDHKKVKVEKGDTVIISATPIPGNEDLVARTINHLFKRGANVIYDPIAPVHVSGHGNREELKLMLNLTRPTYTVPVHGEYRHVAKYTELAEEMGIPRENVFVMEVGDVLEIGASGARLGDKVPAGDVLVDGIGVGDVGDIVLRDRRHLASDGIFMVVIGIDRTTGSVVAGPDIISRGFVYMDEAEELVEEAKKLALETIEGLTMDAATEWSTVKSDVRSALGKLLYSRTRRRPMVVPVIMEI
ncbi:MAG TPA: ribonuclease J [Armatimonadota bacterium]|nr:ribonuclease J [Armatimonadota bacterium]